MLDAVITYGDLGKSGNKVINLVDSKLYTKIVNVLKLMKILIKYLLI